MFAQLVAWLLAALVALLAPHPVAVHRSSAGHPGGGTVDYTAPAPRAPHSGPSSVGRAGPSEAPSVAPAPVAQPSDHERMSDDPCAPGEVYVVAQDLCVAEQLPEEANGRQYG
jgi:hypothetical protein